LKDFRGKSVVKGVFNALIGVPTVALGLFLFLLFSKSGPLGAFQLLYIPLGVSVGQALLVTPIAVSLTVSALESTETQVMDLAKTLGASNIQASLEVLKEAMRGVLLALVASFNRAFAELGVAMMVGGNIKGVTRVLTTTIVLETTRGEWVLSIALTIILLSIVITLSVLVNVLKRD